MRITMATENNNKTLNVPNLRFPEFSGEWTKTKLGDIGTTLIGLTYSPKDVVPSGGTIVLRSSNIKGGLTDYNDIVRVNKKIKESIITCVDDLLICARNGSARLIGKNAILKQEDCGHTFGAFMMVYRAQNNKFVHQLLNTKRYYSQVGENLGARINQITTSDLNSFEFYFPQTLNEQNKIASMLSLLDDRIATQIKIIEDLKKLKSAISNEIFDHTSNRKCELKEIASVIMGQSPSSHAYNNNADGLPLIQGNLDIENGQLSPRIYTSEITQTCECGDVILTVRAPVGEIAIAQQEACIGRGVCSIRPHVKNDTNLIYQFLQYFKPKWGSLEQGSTFTAVSSTDIRGIEVSIPSTDKIQLLDVYDNKIRVESRIHTNLIQQKQYLLAQMFI